MAAAAGIALTWDDFADLAEVTPLLTRIYPNGKADVNHFQAAGGMALLIRELLGGGLLHGDARTVWGEGLADYVVEPMLGAGRRRRLARGGGAERRRNACCAARTSRSRPTGGLRVLEGPLGRAVIKTSAVAPERHVIEAPARVFHSQEELQAAFRAGELFRDFVAVVRFQGPKANGMPELHKLMPPLGVLQDRGHRVALVTDGRMSGASGKVPAAIHVTPEAAAAGRSRKIRDGDIIRLDAPNGRLDVLVEAAEWAARAPATHDLDRRAFRRRPRTVRRLPRRGRPRRTGRVDLPQIGASGRDRAPSREAKAAACSATRSAESPGR